MTGLLPDAVQAVYSPDVMSQSLLQENPMPFEQAGVESFAMQISFYVASGSAFEIQGKIRQPVLEGASRDVGGNQALPVDAILLTAVREPVRVFQAAVYDP
jgi:hypothetical protein